MNKIRMEIDKWGIWFNYKGDSVCYAWPWFGDRKKNFNKRFYSTNLLCYFKSLKDLDKMWEGWEKAMNNHFTCQDDEL